MLNDDVSFTMSDGVVIRGSIGGNASANDLVIMLHSGGYDRRERGVRGKVHTENGVEKIYFEELGNYEYLSKYLANDTTILAIDQRNHGESGKNIDSEKLSADVKEIVPSITDEVITNIILAFKRKDKKAVKEYVENLNVSDELKKKLQEYLKFPPIKDMSFLLLAKDLEEVISQVNKDGRFQNVHLVGTCMGGLVSALYTMDNPDKVKSLTLFSPLFTLEQAFMKPKLEKQIDKKAVVDSGKQFRMGNAVEGLSTYEEVDKILKYFKKGLSELNIPIFCIQGVDDKLISYLDQSELFEFLKQYREQNKMASVHYAECPGVHCLYDTIFTALDEVVPFIYSNLGIKKSNITSR